MKINHKTASRSLVIVGIILLLGLFTISVAQAGPMLQDPRPPAGGDGNGGGSGGGNGGGSDGGGSTDLRCASLDGQVLNWGFGPEANVGIELSTGSWNVATTSATDGRYGFGGLGVGVAKLRVLLAPEQAAQLQPWTQEAAVYLNCDFHTVANIAVFSGSQIQPPATIEMSAPGTLTTSSRTPLKLTVKNDLPNEISGVIVTDLIPPGLVALEVQAASADPQYTKIIDGGDDGQLVVVNLDRVAAGAEANIFITVAVAADVPTGTQIRNTATLFYRESVADQARIDFTVGRGAALAPSQVTAPTPEAEASPATEPQPSPTAQPELTSTPLPTPVAEDEGEEFVPPPESVPTTGENLIPPGLLPTTGEDALVPPALLPETGLGLVLPLGGVGLVGLAFLVHLLRASTRSKE